MKICVLTRSQAVCRHVKIQAVEVETAPSINTQDDFRAPQGGAASSSPSGFAAAGGSVNLWQDHSGLALTDQVASTLTTKLELFS